MWAITRDIINPKCGDQPNLRRSGDWNDDKLTTAFSFQLRDDDDEPYFEGVSTDCSSEEAFAPLDDFGAAYGCTSIWYQNERGAWEQL